MTRWYRAPEVILFSQTRKHLAAIDMWSVGCILSELLTMLRENVHDPKSREPLFPGKSCFPLSACDPDAYKDRMDQLNGLLVYISVFVCLCFLLLALSFLLGLPRFPKKCIFYFIFLGIILVIFDVIGTPTKSEIEKITDPQARAYLQKLASKKAVDLYKRFPGSSPDAINLLQNLLQFDAETRLSVNQALAHPYLEDVRDLEAEV